MDRYSDILGIRLWDTRPSFNYYPMKERVVNSDKSEVIGNSVLMDENQKWSVNK